MGRSGRGKGSKKKRGKQAKAKGQRLPELRFRVGDRVECRLPVDDAKSLEECPLLPAEYIAGTVIKTWHRTGKSEDSLDIAPYLVLLDDGDYMAVYEDMNLAVRASASPGLAFDYAPGARVECKLFEDDAFRWRTGHVLKSDKNWAEEMVPPYLIRFDHDKKPRTFFGPPDFIRPVQLRFNVGERVELFDDEKWLPGTVVKLCVEKECGFNAPYELRFDFGESCVVNFDTDDLLRLSNTPPLVVRFAPGSSIECKPKGEGNKWIRGTIIQSNCDWIYHDRPPYFIRLQDGRLIQFWGPNDCIRADSTSNDNRNCPTPREGDREEMFAPFPPRPECPICFIPFPIDYNECDNKLCCGKAICNGCIYAQANEPGLDNRCPFCRTPTSELEDHFLAFCMKWMKSVDADMIYIMGCCHEFGHGDVPKDDKKALELYLRGAELGSALACRRLAFSFGLKTPKGRPFMEKAAKLGCVQARHNLGCLEFDEDNIELALRHWKLAAGVGFDKALNNVLQCYKGGILSKAEYEAVLRCCQRAKEGEWSKQREIARLAYQAHYSRSDDLDC
ncbi:hypothetical protein ACHAWF_008895 [Thalassiosira exigua]